MPGCCPEGMELASGGVPDLTPELVEAIHAFVAEAPSRVMMVQLEDALGVVDQANMPGTTDEHPNWRQKLPETLEQMSTNPRVLSLAARLAKIRPHPALRNIDTPAAEVRVPRATYRLQFNKTFTFDDAVAVLPYLKQLGVSHVYCSPILKGAAGQHARLRHRRPRRDQPRARRRGRLRALLGGAARARHGPAPRHGAQPHGRARRRQRLVDGRAGKTAPPRSTRTISTSTGTPSTPTSKARCWCRRSASTTARCSPTTSWCCTSSPRAAASRCATTTTGFRSTRAAMRRC